LGSPALTRKRKSYDVIPSEVEETRGVTLKARNGIPRLRLG